MSHQPPIPAANKTIYPRQFAAHDDHGEADGSADTRPVDSQGEKRSWAGISGKTALGAAAGIGSAAILAALLYTSRRKGQPAR